MQQDDVKLELRAVTNSHGSRAMAVVTSSTMPSTKYSCSGSPLMFWNGRIAIDGLSGSGRAAAQPDLVGVRDDLLQGRVGNQEIRQQAGPAGSAQPSSAGVGARFASE